MTKTTPINDAFGLSAQNKELLQRAEKAEAQLENLGELIMSLDEAIANGDTGQMEHLLLLLTKPFADPE